jgi:hypothetical protein
MCLSDTGAGCPTNNQRSSFRFCNNIAAMSLGSEIGSENLIDQALNQGGLASSIKPSLLALYHITCGEDCL